MTLALVGATMAFAGVAMSGGGSDGTAQTQAPLVSPTAYAANMTCAQLFDPGPSYEIKVDPPKSGRYGPLDVTFYDNGTKLRFTTTVAVLGVFVKGGNFGGNFYDYRDYYMPGYVTPGTTADSELVLPNPNQEISHVSFCWDREPIEGSALTVAKTAAGTYDRTTTWELAKSVSPEAHSGLAGGTAGSSTWNVAATKVDAESNFRVTGTITIGNPNPVAVGFSVADTLDDGTAATVDCPASSVPADGSVTCTYTAAPSDRTASSNSVVVTSLHPHVPGNTASASVAWTPSASGDQTVTLADPRLGISESITATRTLTPTESFECPGDVALYTNGVHTYTEENTATLTGAGTELREDASVEVTCYLLSATKTAVGSLERTITWELEKTVEPASHSGLAGEVPGSSEWTISATKSVALGNYAVTGEITIVNPAPFAVPFSISDALSDGTVASVDCPTQTVAAAPGSVTCTYAAAPEGANANLNTATITPDGGSALTATAPVSFTITNVGDDSVVIDDDRRPAGFPITVDSSSSWKYEETFRCSSDAGDYTDGSRSTTHPNTATASGSNTSLSSTATVTLECALPALTAEKTAAGSFERTIDWELSKSVDPASHSGNAGETAGSSTWQLTATKSVTLGNYRVSGEITISNPSAIARTFSVNDRLDDGTEAEVSCPASTVAANDSITCSYSASPADAGATLNTATVSSPGGDDVVATAPVAFTATTIGDETATLADPRFDHSESISETKTVSFPETFRCSADADDYPGGSRTDRYTNTATLSGESTSLSRSAQVDVECVLPLLAATKTATASFDRTIEWQLAKSVAPGSHDGKVGETAGSSTWQVTATKSVELGNHRVSGEITISNTSAVAIPFSITDELDDGTVATVTCPASIVPANGSVTCTYEATPADASATLNTATVMPAAGDPVVATAAVSFTARTIGDETVTLADPRFGHSQSISATTPLSFPEAFTCPSEASLYSGGAYGYVETNTASLTGAATNLTRQAQVTIRCARTEEPPPPPPPAPESPAPPVPATAQPAIDLAITKTDAPDPVGVGATLTYTLTVTNRGPSTATGVTVVDALPSQVSFVSASSTQGACTAVARTITCTIGVLPVGATVRITILVRPTSPGAIINEAVVSGAEPETNPSDNRAEAATLVHGAFTPPVVRCPTLTVQPRTLPLGRPAPLVATVRLDGRGVRGVRVSVRGPGINRIGTTGGNGVLRMVIQPRQAGILTLRMTNQPARCNTARVGIVGVFRPPVTG